ncbi:MAG: TIGR03668 family PPOX class F420-dependent oxidoreductase [Dehalococcoidia bacterium]|nr:TIGR03668 family PPOX class F420-dependent oxidoreductase [Dehalococcoidia bacterium]
MERQIEQFVRDQRVARLATVDGRGGPHIVPIVFAYAAGRLYTPIDLKPKSAPPERLRRVRNIQANANVQVLLDRYDEDWRHLGYVQLRGRAELIERGREHSRALRLLERKYPQYAELPLEGRPVIKVTVERTVTWGRLAGASTARERKRPGESGG